MGYSVLINIIWIIFAYFIGSINFSIIFTTLSKEKQHIKTVGSGNAGATNAMREYGIKFGILIFILDASKSFWFAFMAGMLQNKVEAFQDLIPQLSTIFVIIGHIFPIWFNFKGGKGAATNLGFIASISLLLAAIGFVLFVSIVYYTKYVSLGSIIVPYMLATLSTINPILNGWHDSAIHYGPWWITTLCLFIAALIVTASHHKNIIRLIKKEERKISFSSNKEN